MPPLHDEGVAAFRDRRYRTEALLVNIAVPKTAHLDTDMIRSDLSFWKLGSYLCYIVREMQSYET
jgi:hypothetical protein